MNVSGRFSHTYPRRMTNTFLEQFYENIILSRYEEFVRFGAITWFDHGKVGLDTWAHYFKSGDKEYVLVYEDFPGNTDFDDGLSHEVVKCGDETSIELRFSDDARQVPNVTGWFTLYQEQ